MGKAISGPNGPITGKLGNLVYYQVKGEQRVRTQGKITVPPSRAQLEVRQGMKVISSFLKLITEFVNIGFKTVATGSKTAFNMATSYNRLHALVGDYPDLEVDFSKVLVSQGTLKGALDLSVDLIGSSLIFSWDGSSPLVYPAPIDQTMTLAFFPVQNRVVYGLFNARRSDGAVTLVIPEDLVAEPMHVYFTLVSADRNRVSDSQYLGKIN